MKVIVFDPTNAGRVGMPEIKEREIGSLTIVDGMFVKELNLTPLAYVYKAEHRKEVEIIMQGLSDMRKMLADFEGEMYYKVLPKYRAK